MAEDERPQFGTVGLYEKLAATLNEDEHWRELARPISYTMVFEYLAPIDACYFLRFAEGEITEVKELEAPDELGPVDFVITAKPEIFAAMIRREMQPTAGLATGKVKVAGNKTALLRHMRRFNYLLDQMCAMDPVFV